MDVISKENGFTEKISRAKVSEFHTNIFCVPVKVYHSSNPVTRRRENMCEKRVFLNFLEPESS